MDGLLRNTIHQLFAAAVFISLLALLSACGGSEESATTANTSIPVSFGDMIYSDGTISVYGGENSQEIMVTVYTGPLTSLADGPVYEFHSTGPIEHPVYIRFGDNVIAADEYLLPAYYDERKERFVVDGFVVDSQTIAVTHFSLWSYIKDKLLRLSDGQQHRWSSRKIKGAYIGFGIQGDAELRPALEADLRDREYNRLYLNRGGVGLAGQEYKLTTPGSPASCPEGLTCELVFGINEAVFPSAAAAAHLAGSDDFDAKVVYYGSLFSDFAENWAQEHLSYLPKVVHLNIESFPSIDAEAASVAMTEFFVSHGWSVSISIGDTWSTTHLNSCS